MPSRPSRTIVALSFFAIYVIWGSTYLAIRYAVETVPPLTTAAMRHSIAGLLLFAWAYSRGYRPTWREWKASVVVGFLFFLLGHGGLHWAEQTVPSGLAALIVATEPIWLAILVALPPGGTRPTAPAIAGQAIGLAGVALLMGPMTLEGSAPGVLVGAVVILGGTLAWTLGIVYAARSPMPREPLARAALPLLAGAAWLSIALTLAGEPARLAANPVSLRSALAVGYLVTFGSLVAFTAYTWLLGHFPATLVATHTYVNPVVAVWLGWALGNEAITPRVLIAGAMIVVAVVLVNAGTRVPARRRSRAPAGVEAGST
jgi:drug/metabolite transporter (DMT)-like permease